MLDTYYTEKLFGLQATEIKSIEENEGKILLTVQLQRKACKCPACGKETDKVHDYRKQLIKDLSAFEKAVDILLFKRRYACICGKRFYEPNSFLTKYQRMTKRCIMGILEKLTTVVSYKSVAKEFRISTSTVIRYFENVCFPTPPKLPEAIGIDEFKGNSGGEKFHCILTNLTNKRVSDIMKSRKMSYLSSYFRKCDRTNVKYFVSDMYKPYADIARTYFPNATYIIDKYHWVRQSIWAFESVRKEIQKRFSNKHRIYFKHSKKLLLKRENALTPEEQVQVRIMLDCSAELSSAYFLKEQIYRILDEPDSDIQKSKFSDWIEEAYEKNIPAFKKCAETYRRWFDPICNSFYYTYTNGYTEGCNNKIKVMKRNAFGVHNFNRFRNRILLMFTT